MENLFEGLNNIYYQLLKGRCNYLSGTYCLSGQMGYSIWKTFITFRKGYI